MNNNLDLNGNSINQIDNKSTISSISKIIIILVVFGVSVALFFVALNIYKTTSARYSFLNEIRDKVSSKYNIEKSDIKLLEFVPEHSIKVNQCTFSYCPSESIIERYGKFEYKNKTFTVIGSEDDFFQDEIIEQTKDYYASIFEIDSKDIFFEGDTLDSECTGIFAYEAANISNNYNVNNLKVEVENLEIRMDKDDLENKIHNIIDNLNSIASPKLDITIYDSNIEFKEYKKSTVERNVVRHDKYCVSKNDKNEMARIDNVNISNLKTNEYFTEYNGYYYSID